MDGNLEYRSSIVIVGRPAISEARHSQPFTALELERMGSDSWFELIHGTLYETWPLDINTALIITELSHLLYKHIHSEKLGHILGGVGFVFEREPDTVIAPKVAFVRSDRIPDSRLPHGFFPGTPDLAIEAASSLDSQVDLERKRKLYERLPVPLLWWIDPERQTASVQRAGRSIQHLGQNDVLDGEQIVPGFTVQLAKLFEASPTFPNWRETHLQIVDAALRVRPNGSHGGLHLRNMTRDHSVQSLIRRTPGTLPSGSASLSAGEIHA